MARLPTVGGDISAWGTVLNTFLSVAHNNDGSLKNLFYNVKDPAYGAVGDGSHDDTVAIQAAITAVAAGGGTVFFPAGTYKVTSTLTATTVPTYLLGAGIQATILSYTGSGDCLRMYNSGTDAGGNPFGGGGIAGMTINGTGAAAGACGLHVGDISSYELNVRVQDFSGTGSIGIHFDNQYTWTEKLHGIIFAYNCTAHVVFDRGNTGTNSFDRMRLNIFIGQGAATQNGVVLQNGAVFSHGYLYIGGNFLGSASPLTSSVLSLSGSWSGAYAYISYSELSIGVECDSTNTYGPYTIFFGTGTFIQNCFGLMGFTQSTTAFTPSNTPAQLQYYGGFISGDTGLSSSYEASFFTATNSISATYEVAAGDHIKIGASSYLYSGTGAPATGLGAVGNYYFRSDTPGTSLQRLYVKTATAVWTELLAPAVSATAVAVATSDTIATAGIDVSRVAPAGAVTGVILASGTVPGQVCQVVNESAFSVTFATAATSNVADGVSAVIAANRKMDFTWDASTSKWYHS